MVSDARKAVDEMLAYTNIAEELEKVGITNKVQPTFSGRGMDTPLRAVRFFRPYQEADVTNYDDLTRQYLVTSHGVDFTVTGAPHDTDLFGALLLLGEYRKQSLRLNRALGLSQSEVRALQERNRLLVRDARAKNSENEAHLLAMWDAMGGRSRKRISASLRALCQNTEERASKVIDDDEYDEGDDDGT